MSLELQQVDYVERDGAYEPTPPYQISGLVPPSIRHEDYLDRLDEINESWRIYKSPLSGRKFEVAVVNQDKLESEAVAFPSTHFSSLTQNPGNAIELAAHGAANPEVARIYVAYFGNGGSSNLPRSERRYLARTGRFTTGSNNTEDPYHPIGGIQEMALTLIEQGLVPTHISGDESGARLAVGLASAFEPGTIKDGYLNGMPGISAELSYAKPMVKEDMQSRGRRRKIEDPMPGEITTETLKEAHEHLGDIYKGVGHTARIASTYARALPNLIANTRAFGGHNNLESPQTHAAMQDIVATLLKHEVSLTLQFNLESAIHDIDKCIEFGRIAMNSIPSSLRSEKRNIRLLIGTGALDRHTEIPQERWRTERYSFPSIRNFFARKEGGRIIIADTSLPQVATLSGEALFS
jgi:hypothetical protein